jgi:hypothetical protein
MARRNIQVLAVRAHYLAWGASGLVKLVVPTSNPFILNRRLLTVGKLVLVTFYKESNGEHITARGLVASTLAGSADDARKKGATTLVRSDWTVTRCVAWVAATGSTITKMTATLPMIPETRTLATFIITTPRRGTCTAVGIAAVSKVTALSLLKETMIPAVLELKDTGLVALNMAERKFVVVDQVPYGVWTTKFVDTGWGKVPNTSHSVIVEHGGEAAETKMVGDIAVIVDLAKRIELSLEQGCDISIIRLWNGPEEDAGACAGVEVVVLLRLETEVEEICLTEIEELGVAAPGGRQNGNRGVEARNGQFQYAPKKIIAIIGFRPDRGDGRIDFWNWVREERGKDVHHCWADLPVT